MSQMEPKLPYLEQFQTTKLDSTQSDDELGLKTPTYHSPEVPSTLQKCSYLVSAGCKRMFGGALRPFWIRLWRLFGIFAILVIILAFILWPYTHYLPIDDFQNAQSVILFVSKLDPFRFLWGPLKYQDGHIPPIGGADWGVGVDHGSHLTAKMSQMSQFVPNEPILVGQNLIENSNLRGDILQMSQNLLPPPLSIGEVNPKPTIGVVNILNTIDNLIEFIEYYIDQGVTYFAFSVDRRVNHKHGEALIEDFKILKEFYNIHHPSIMIRLQEFHQIDHLSGRELDETCEYYGSKTSLIWQYRSNRRANRPAEYSFQTTKEDLKEIFGSFPDYMIWVDGDEYMIAKDYSTLADYFAAIPTLDNELGSQYRAGTLSGFVAWMHPYGLPDANVISHRTWLERDENGDIQLKYVPFTPYYNRDVVFESMFAPLDDLLTHQSDVSDDPTSLLDGPFHPPDYVDPRSIDDNRGRMLRLESLTREMADPRIYSDKGERRAIFERAVVQNNEYLKAVKDEWMSTDTQTMTSYSPKYEEYARLKRLSISAKYFPFITDKARYSTTYLNGRSYNTPMTYWDHIRLMYSTLPECIYGVGQHVELTDFPTYIKNRVTETGDAVPNPNIDTLLKLTNDSSSVFPYNKQIETGTISEQFLKQFLRSESPATLLPYKSRVGTPFAPRYFIYTMMKQALIEKRRFERGVLTSDNSPKEFAEWHDLAPEYCTGKVLRIYEHGKMVMYTKYYRDYINEISDSAFDYIHSGYHPSTDVESNSPSTETKRDNQLSLRGGLIDSTNVNGDLDQTISPSTNPFGGPSSSYFGQYERSLNVLFSLMCSRTGIHHCVHNTAIPNIKRQNSDVIVEHKAFPSLESRFDHSYIQRNHVNNAKDFQMDKIGEDWAFFTSEHFRQRRQMIVTDYLSTELGYPRMKREDFAGLEGVDVWNEEVIKTPNAPIMDSIIKAYSLMDSSHQRRVDHLVESLMGKKPKAQMIGVVGEGPKLTYAFDQLYYDRRYADYRSREYDPRTITASSLVEDSMIALWVDYTKDELSRYIEERQRQIDTSTSNESPDKTPPPPHLNNTYLSRILLNYSPILETSEMFIVDDELAKMGFKIYTHKQASQKQ